MKEVRYLADGELTAEDKRLSLTDDIVADMVVGKAATDLAYDLRQIFGRDTELVGIELDVALTGVMELHFLNEAVVDLLGTTFLTTLNLSILRLFLHLFIEIEKHGLDNTLSYLSLEDSLIRIIEHGL